MINKSIKILMLFLILSLGFNMNTNATISTSPEDGIKIEAFIEKNKDLISKESQDYLYGLKEKLDRCMVLSQEETEYIRECHLEVIRKKLGDAQFEEYKKLIEKRSSDAEFTQPERFRLYELEKMLK